MQSDRNASRTNCNWINKKTLQKPNDASRPYVPLPMFLAWEVLFRTVHSVVRCRKTSILVEALINCRIPWRYVELRRKLLRRWRRGKNTHDPSNSGSLKPGSASHKGAGKNRQRKQARFALFGPRSELPLPMGKAWPAFASGLKRKAVSSLPCKV
jgi:hypothetical protein